MSKTLHWILFRTPAWLLLSCPDRRGHKPSLSCCFAAPLPKRKMSRAGLSRGSASLCTLARSLLARLLQGGTHHGSRAPAPLRLLCGRRLCTNIVAWKAVLTASLWLTQKAFLIHSQSLLLFYGRGSAIFVEL